MKRKYSTSLSGVLDQEGTLMSLALIAQRLNEFEKLKTDAYFMRYVIHESVMYNWREGKEKDRMTDIVYDPVTNKVREQ